MTTLSDICRTSLQGPVEAPAIEFEHNWYSWGDLRHVADQLEDAIRASGSGDGAKIAFVARNHPAHIAAFLGMLANNCTVRMVYPFQSAQALSRELQAIQPALVVADARDYTDTLQASLAERGITAIALGERELRAYPGLAAVNGPEDQVNSPTVEILTSGTTGPPKPFAITHEDIARHIVSNSALPPQLQGGAEDLPPALLMFPISNISGLYSTLPPLLAGQRVVLLERFTVEGWHDHLLRYRPAVSGMPPAGVQMVLDADIPPRDLECLQVLGTGAAPLDPGVKQAFEQRYGVPILLSYGATEFGGPVTRMTPELQAEWGERKFGSVGRALPGVSLRVIDPDTGVELPAGKEGLLEVISPRIGAGWIRTTDIVVLDEDGFLFHRGRTDGAITRGGFKLLPATIEQGLLTHPAIAQACVIGLPDARLGQVPAAALELRPGATPPAIAGIEAHLRERVPSTHIPTRWRIVTSLPRTPSMKVNLPAVRALFDEAQEGENAHEDA